MAVFVCVLFQLKGDVSTRLLDVQAEVSRYTYRYISLSSIFLKVVSNESW